MNPEPPTGLCVIPIQILSGRPWIESDGRHYLAVPGSYIVIKGAFELMPEFDCLFADASKPQTD